MPCLFRYRWLKLPRTALPQGKGLSVYWAKLAARAAFRKGVASYCGYENPVDPGMWSGGVVGLKSILGVKKRERALEILEQLSSHGYLSYELNPETKQLTYYEYEDILIAGIPLKHALFFIIGLLTCISILVALQIASVRISEDDDFDDNDE